jgi:hypothetical protein
MSHDSALTIYRTCACDQDLYVPVECDMFGFVTGEITCPECRQLTRIEGWADELIEPTIESETP